MSDRAYLVGPFSRETRAEAQAGLRELAELAAAAGLEPVGAETVRVRTPTASHYLGSGQTTSIIASAAELEADLIVFDQPLSPVQLRNWARDSHLEVYDRHAVILEIFYRRAGSHEAQLQVELARARYAQSHLVGMWQHLGRQGGGSRLARGEGEKQIEMDRRHLAARVTRARSALARVARQREVRRSRRQQLHRVALVGYTNAGKSSLLNRLVHAQVVARNALFATLDPTTRRLFVPPDSTVLVTDTVGFVRRLPPDLVDAFHSTLEEAIEADLLLLVVDGSDPDVADHLATTTSVLEQIGATGAERITVVNKSDLLDEQAQARLSSTDLGSEVVFVSAADGGGIDELRRRISLNASRAG